MSANTTNLYLQTTRAKHFWGPYSDISARFEYYWQDNPKSSLLSLNCEGRHGLYPATQAAAATSELLAVFAESVQTLNTNWQLPGRQSQPETPEVTRRQRSAHQTAAQSCGRRHSGEKCYNQNRRARIQSTPQTDVARHSQKIQSAEKVPRSHHFNPQPFI